MKKLNSCPVCNEQSFSKVHTCKDHSASKEDFTIVCCDECNFTFTNPRPEDENLGAYYISDKYISHTNTAKSLFENFYQIVRKYAIGQKLKLIMQFSTQKNQIIWKLKLLAIYWLLLSMLEIN